MRGGSCIEVAKRFDDMSFSVPVHRDLSTLKASNSLHYAIVFVAFAGALLAVELLAQNGLPPGREVGLYLLIGAVFATSAVARALPRRLLEHERLTVAGGRLHAPLADGTYSAELAELSPVATVHGYRPFGVFPERRYVRLEVDGGPLGTRKFYFDLRGEEQIRQILAHGIEVRPEHEAAAVSI